MFFASNFYLPYLFNDINKANFNIRTRAINIVLLYTAGIAGASTAGFVLDTESLRRSVRVKIAIAMLVTGFTSIWTGALAWQHGTTRAQTEAQDFRLIDFTDRAYIGPLLLFLAFGFIHCVFQYCNDFFITVLADNIKTASGADIAGFFRSIEALGLAVSLKLTSLELSFMTDLIIAWILTIGSVLVAGIMLIMRVQDAGVFLVDEAKETESDQIHWFGNHVFLGDESNRESIGDWARNLIGEMTVPSVHGSHDSKDMSKDRRSTRWSAGWPGHRVRHLV